MVPDFRVSSFHLRSTCRIPNTRVFLDKVRFALIEKLEEFEISFGVIRVTLTVLSPSLLGRPVV